MTTVNKTDLQKALEIVKPGLAPREMVEQSTSFAFLNGRVVTYNDEISVSHPIDGLGLEIEGAIQADKLYSLLTKIKKNEVEVSITDNEIQFKAGRTKAGLMLQTEVRLPLEELGEIGDWQPLPEDFLEVLTFTMWTCSNDMSKPILTCVHVSQDGVMESSDNYRITRREFGTESEELPVPSFLIPATSVRDLARFNVTHIAQGEGWVHFKTAEDTVFSCRVFDDSYPDVRPFFEFDGEEVELPRTMPEILDRTAIFGEGALLDQEVQIKIAKRRMTVRAQSSTGWIEEVAPVRYDGPDIHIVANPSFLKEVTSKVRTCIIGERALKFVGDGWEHVVALTISEG